MLVWVHLVLYLVVVDDYLFCRAYIDKKALETKIRKI